MVFAKQQEQNFFRNFVEVSQWELITVKRIYQLPKRQRSLQSHQPHKYPPSSSVGNNNNKPPPPTPPPPPLLEERLPLEMKTRIKGQLRKREMVRQACLQRLRAELGQCWGIIARDLFAWCWCFFYFFITRLVQGGEREKGKTEPLRRVLFARKINHGASWLKFDVFTTAPLDWPAQSNCPKTRLFKDPNSKSIGIGQEFLVPPLWSVSAPCRSLL